jgi:hypothetical protein
MEHLMPDDVVEVWRLQDRPAAGVDFWTTLSQLSAWELAYLRKGLEWKLRNLEGESEAIERILERLRFPAMEDSEGRRRTTIVAN